jgi:transcription termination/antitermination protein NusG
MKNWYVIQVYAGYEDQVKVDLEKRVKKDGAEDLIGQVLIPSAKLKSFFSEIDAKDQKLFPGYIIVEIENSPEAMGFVKTTPRVLKFLGGKEPMPLSKKEIERVTDIKNEVIVTSSAKESGFAEGNEVDIQDGPFAGFVGIIEKVDNEAERLTVMVSIFGRLTPVELSFHQVKH